MKTYSILERQVIRLCVFIIALFGIILGSQQFLALQLTSFESWIYQSISVTWLAYLVMLAPVAIGIFLFIGKLTHREFMIIWGLGLMCLYQTMLGIFNLIAYAFQGTPWIASISIGVMSAIFWAYYRTRDNEVQDLDLKL